MSEWLTKDLDSVANIAIGGTPSRGVAKYWAATDGDGECWVSIADLRKRIVESSKERITLEGVNSSNVKPVPAGTLIMSFKLSIGRAAIAGCDLYTNEAIAAIIPKLGEIESEYLYYILPPKAANAITDTAVKGSTLNKKTLGKLSLTYPKDGCVQKKIANILQTVDDAIAQTEALIEKYSLVKAGMMHDLFTRGLTPNGKLRPPREEAPDLYKETPIGWIPRDWEFKTIDECANIHNNLRLPLSSEVREGMRGEYPYYGPTGVVGFIDEFRADGIYVLIGEDGDHFLKYFYKEMTQKVEGKFNVNNHAHILSGKDGCSTDWLFYYFLHRDITFWLTRQGAGRYKLNKAALQKLPLARPKPEEQDEIAKHILFYRNMLDTNATVLAKLREQKKGIMHDLLTGDVQVTLNNLEAANV